MSIQQISAHTRLCDSKNCGALQEALAVSLFSRGQRMVPLLDWGGPYLASALRHVPFLSTPMRALNLAFLCFRYTNLNTPRKQICAERSSNLFTPLNNFIPRKHYIANFSHYNHPALHPERRMNGEVQCTRRHKTKRMKCESFMLFQAYQ